MHRTGGVAKHGKRNHAVRGFQSPERYRDAPDMFGDAGSIPALARFLQENRLRLVKMPGESMRAISREK